MPGDIPVLMTSDEIERIIKNRASELLPGFEIRVQLGPPWDYQGFAAFRGDFKHAVKTLGAIRTELSATKFAESGAAMIMKKYNELNNGK